MSVSPVSASASASAPIERSGPVLFYDGECGLCNRVVRMLLRMDRRGVLRFAPLQGATAQHYLRTHGLPFADFDSLVFVPEWTRRGHAEFLLRTDGVLAAARTVGGWGRALAWASLVPRSWRDAGYRLIARWRYRIWGRWRSCPLPKPEWVGRFLD